MSARSASPQIYFDADDLFRKGHAISAASVPVSRSGVSLHLTRFTQLPICLFPDGFRPQATPCQVEQAERGPENGQGRGRGERCCGEGCFRGSARYRPQLCLHDLIHELVSNSCHSDHRLNTSQLAVGVR